MIPWFVESQFSRRKYKSLEFQEAWSLNSWESVKLVWKVPIKHWALGHTYQTHIMLIRSIPRLPWCQYAAKVFSTGMKNTTNWAIVYMAWRNCSTIFLIDVTSCLGILSKCPHTQMPCVSHYRFQRCSNSSLPAFWKLRLETLSNKYADLFLI